MLKFNLFICEMIINDAIVKRFLHTLMSFLVVFCSMKILTTNVIILLIFLSEIFHSHINNIVICLMCRDISLNGIKNIYNIYK